MSTKFNMTRDINGYNGFGIPFSLDNWNAELAANVVQNLTVPDNYPNWIAIFSYSPGSEVWVDGITTALIPAGAFTADSSQLNPSARAVTGGSTLSFITGDITLPFVSVSFYVAPPFGN